MRLVRGSSFLLVLCALHFRAFGENSTENELASYYEYEDGDDFDFTDVPIGSHVDVRASTRWDFAIFVMCAIG